MTCNVALENFLEPLAPYLNMPNVTDICINRPGEIWVEQGGEFTPYEDEALTRNHLLQLATLVGEANGRDVDSSYPSLSAVLPNGLRSQFVIPPACDKSQLVIAIRQIVMKDVPIAKFLQHPMSMKGAKAAQRNDNLVELYRSGDIENFLKQAVLSRKNIMIAGGTSAGKTVALNSLLNYIPLSERLITIETDREVKPKHPNVVHLLASEERQGISNMSMLDLLKATLRLRPDRILLSEIRDHSEASPYLRAINSGHPGSITTMHADTPKGCFDQLAFMLLQGGSQLKHEVLLKYVKFAIPIIIQLEKDWNGSARYFSEIYYVDAE